MEFQTIRDLDVKNKIVLLRADLNVPAQKGIVRDTTRIDRLKPTIDYLRKQGAKILLLSHFGRPEGEQNPEMSLIFLLPALQKSFGVEKIRFAQDCIGPSAKTLADSLQPGEVGLLENLRFHKGEKSNDPAFARELASLGDLYVNDAFSAAHRAHASTEGLAHLLPAAAGFLMEEELRALNKALGDPEKPVMALTGGAKISTKLNILNNLVKKVDYLVLGGAMANTFLFANGADIGDSLCERDMAVEAKSIMETALNYGCRIILPQDSIVVKEIAEKAKSKKVSSQQIPEGFMAIDIGPKSIAHVKSKMALCKTIVWNGPVGVFEVKPFDKGTNELARFVAEQTKAGALVSIAGGGDTISALENAGAAKGFTYVSSAGGAFLEWLEGRELPGIKALCLAYKAA